MSVHRGPWARRSAVLLLVTSLAFAIPVAHANESGAPIEDAEGWRKVIAYAACAWQVFRALTPADVATASLMCGRLLLEEPPTPNGGV